MARNSTPITVIGNLTQEPELRFSAQGTAVCRFTVAFNPRRDDKNAGKWEDGSPSFYLCTAFAQLGENLAESLKKGDRVIVAGELEQQHWEKDGEKRSGWQVVVNDVGPSLAWATAKVNKTARASRGELAPDDPWASASTTRPDAPPVFGSGDEPPAF